MIQEGIELMTLEQGITLVQVQWLIMYIISPLLLLLAIACIVRQHKVKKKLKKQVEEKKKAAEKQAKEAEKKIRVEQKKVIKKRNVIVQESTSEQVVSETSDSSINWDVDNPLELSDEEIISKLSEQIKDEQPIPTESLSLTFDNNGKAQGG